ncbi:ubiquitin-conjugating enzyme, putative [Plasmodium ovale wallikeri]|uniref:Ubiquitin-conjugating enzyme, putative n=1 Tax=Plasmodium ovale wallikeri TaxID=864142 RepID=A0A1A8YSY7_PLAOA|nr:ubiquitin-conjugating enzyme, putative [Plasmodium ovale wallikeri]SBT34767.1 ubiquitin-conjugating enzyme, putative [Plasmodium ovale wallikeri]
MSTFARRRIIQDLNKINKEQKKTFEASPFADNIMCCHAIIRGPEDTIWECGIFHLIINFSEEYPVSPPKSLLNDPNTSSPANPEAARIFISNRALYNKRVLMCVEDSWEIPKFNINNFN